ncbi:2-oxoacid:acceptor oxidoreductase subunit alpha [Porphyromonas levii]|uniref:2-oxoacid:acceptor oxidoreductase subunit alpha n=1 Tax=Porphyromonas levii TaxID=28114 RepID=A0A4Y8WQV2_9PORP|nr:2-oxoacid:acceptor oxidoreductase subunit alpha [Porphyromonas levii]MBR8702772.1 2-oxoglutarate oxidoreductase subunit KorA [Porphyromonas levii]MBR8729930.1 2-oxoglutarate oxidoreductase subunit KorA [Porphyromonas levii]MBR8760007.1 2-oxoglutarate oxidoreductase subunit KorA [Porphyromonas levii]MBR8765316.1 2-oxoglutarate oxidoreductase subunit KorA [Porphyromonas levii]MBR8774124.1 2-oxoglutarate oxidoreductase subunit KorA [Porphyromonas levii]
MNEKPSVQVLNDVVVRFAGDSGDGMQLTGSIFSDVSAILGNQISTFPDYPAEIRAPKGSLGGVSGFQVRIGTEGVYTPGDYADVLVAMNPSALKVNTKNIKETATIIIDSSAFDEAGLKKGEYKTDNPFTELGLNHVQVLEVPISEMVRDGLKDTGMDVRAIDRSKNMFALGLILWLYNKEIAPAEQQLQKKFSKKQEALKANLKILTDGYNYGHNIHATTTTYRIEGRDQKPGNYTDINGNTATAYGLVAAADKAGLGLFLGSYPITPATDILHELAKLKHLGVKTVQAEDEISGICTAIGASYAGSLAVTTTSGPGLALKSEALGYTVMAELPLVLIDVMRGGPSTGLPTKSEQTDLLQALHGRNGESPLVVIAATSPNDCFDAAFTAAKIAVEHMTPVILLTDAFIGNGASAWRIPDLSTYPTITPRYVQEYYKGDKPWTPYMRDEKSLVRYWAVPGSEGYMHRVGGLEKHSDTGAICTEPTNHSKMVQFRQEKIARIAEELPLLEVYGDESADTLVVGWGSTYGHILSAVDQMEKDGRGVAMTHFKFINPLPKNTEEVLRRYKNIVIVEQSMGQFAQFISGQISGLNIFRYNKVEGQPLKVEGIVDFVNQILNGCNK